MNLMWLCPHFAAPVFGKDPVCRTRAVWQFFGNGFRSSVCPSEWWRPKMLMGVSHSHSMPQRPGLNRDARESSK